MSDRHKAPRRRVESVSRLGGYGTTWWLHRLECGHVERRKRLSPKSQIGCASCKMDDRLLIESIVNDGSQSRDVQVEVEADQLKAALASALGVPLDAVGVSTGFVGGKLEITGAMVHLHALAARNVADRFAQRSKSN